MTDENKKLADYIVEFYEKERNQIKLKLESEIADVSLNDLEKIIDDLKERKTEESLLDILDVIHNEKGEE